jgi:Lipase (class 3)
VLRVVLRVVNVFLTDSRIRSLSFFLPPSAHTQSTGLNVAFVSSAFTRNLYKGLVEVTPISCSDLPDEDSTVESIATGGGVDAAIVVAAVEGSIWKEDIELLEKEPYHAGVFDLKGAAHVGRSRTAWANVNINQSNAAKRKTGQALPYHIPKKWNRAPQAQWPEDETPFYLYVQDPENVQLVFTLMDDDVLGEGSAISSTHIPLAKYLPQAKYSQQELVARVKKEIVSKIQKGELDESMLDDEVAKAVAENIKAWEGDLKMTVKPRIKNKNGQVAVGAAAGAWLAGPVGAAAGAALGSLYEGRPRGIMRVRLRYIPVPQQLAERPKYKVLGGMPGITWGDLYEKYLTRRLRSGEKNAKAEAAKAIRKLGGDDLEHCFFINHDKTGASCAVYRSLEQRLIVVSFRGTCQPIDLITDASIFQIPWVEGKYDEDELLTIPKVHVGFRKSMNSISRRLKELIIATVSPGESISDYDLLVTGHSLGGALATLFVADVAEFGLDAGRSLPQKEPSQEWWKSIANTFMGQKGEEGTITDPPRPKSIRMYNFGSPRVGDSIFAEKFERLMEEGRIQQAYRIVNSQDIIARVPRPMLNIDYEHCGRTVLIEEPLSNITAAEVDKDPTHVLWIEGESDFDRIDPVRDYRNATKSPLASGSLLDELIKTFQSSSPDDIGEQQTAAMEALQEAVFEIEKATGTKDPIGDLASTLENNGDGSKDGARTSEEVNEAVKTNPVLSQLGAVASRLTKASFTDLASIVGIERTYATRELQLAQSFLQGEALAHHLEDSYYMALGRSVGLVATIGEEIREIGEEIVESVVDEILDEEEESSEGLHTDS